MIFIVELPVEIIVGYPQQSFRLIYTWKFQINLNGLAAIVRMRSQRKQENVFLDGVLVSRHVIGIAWWNYNVRVHRNRVLNYVIDYITRLIEEETANGIIFHGSARARLLSVMHIKGDKWISGQKKAPSIWIDLRASTRNGYSQIVGSPVVHGRAAWPNL